MNKFVIYIRGVNNCVVQIVLVRAFACTRTLRFGFLRQGRLGSILHLTIVLKKIVDLKWYM